MAGMMDIDEDRMDGFDDDDEGRFEERKNLVF
jgi:hypothetical protein